MKRVIAQGGFITLLFSFVFNFICIEHMLFC